MKARPSNRLNDNGPPPNSAASLFTGTVMHHRMKPREHRFSYKVFSVLLDLDRLDEAARSSLFFSVNRFNLLSFHQKDHGPRDGADLRPYVNELLAKEGLEAPARIMLLAYPRMLGYGFNPLSVYYAYDRSNRLIALVYEVRNTFGGLHTYVAPVLSSQSSDAGIRQDQKKLFYVSPFISMEQHYFFRMLPPGNTVRVRILEKDTEGPLLSATFSGTHSPLTSKAILRACLRVPLLTYKVIGAIHWEAFKIWRKRVPFHARPTMDAGNDGSKRQAGNVLPVTNN
ncbi:DUF1365 domain-containing protein [Roseibium sp. FZY0029]|uniref:DUF1365 domain-containing protein n=1 Tax=Roseibium sp. FZY0029 TaxID=3116647 RepID=UPI002EBD9AC9|nr:DUF1365 domain-containing protein [Roseibium sp. FZY0029]